MPQGQRRPPRRRVAGPPPGTWAWGRAFFLGEVAAPQLTAAPRRFTASNVNNVNLSLTPIRSAINVYVDNIESEKRSEEHTSELQSLMRIAYAVFCLKKKNETRRTKVTTSDTNPTHNRQT